MKFRLLTILIFFITGAASAQSSGNSPPTEGPNSKQYKVNEYNRSCIFRNNYSASQRKAFYPFNKASAIKLISFPCREEGICGIPRKGDQILFSSLKEIKQLKSAQIDELTNILYNHSYRDKFNFETEILCYNPRNAILFYDEKGKIFAFIELCFECQDAELSSPKINLGDNCVGKYQLLQKFFVKSGINYGTK